MNILGQIAEAEFALRASATYGRMDGWTDGRSGPITIYLLFLSKSADTRRFHLLLPDNLKKNHLYILLLFLYFQWSLVCDREWTVATITTLQMIGVLVGCFIAGQLADWIGRKWVYFLSLVSFPVLNIIAYFSVSWKMYAVLRLLLGVMLGFDISSKLNLVCEFLTTSWRPVFIAFPIWCIAAGAFALLAWLCQDWKTVHLATALAGVPSVLIWW